MQFLEKEIQMTYKPVNRCSISFIIYESPRYFFFNLSYWQRLTHLMIHNSCMVMRKPLEAIQIGAISLEDHKFKIYIVVNSVILLPEMYSIDTLPHASKIMNKDIHCNIV